MAAAALESRDWSGLLPDLLQEIAGRLTEIPDRIRFRCVCLRWRSAAESIARPPRQLPWLLIPMKSDPNTRKHHFWSFAENRIYELPLINSSRSEVISFSHLCLSLTCSMPLPPWLPPLPNNYLGRFVQKAKVSSYDLVAALMFDTAILFCRPADTAWKEISTPFDLPMAFSLLHRDFALHGNRFFYLSSPRRDRCTCVVCVFDMDAAQEVRKIRAPKVSLMCRHRYLVETPSGELLLVIRNDRDAGDESKMFQLFRLDESKLKWRKISGIGDNVLFAGRYQAIALDARGLTCCKRNIIYFVDLSKDFVLLFDIEKGRIEEAPTFEVKVSSLIEWQHGNWMLPTIC